MTIPTLVIHGDSDGIVPFEVSGKRSAEAIAGSELVVIKDDPHGINASHASEFNEALLAFLAPLSTALGPGDTRVPSRQPLWPLTADLVARAEGTMIASFDRSPVHPHRPTDRAAGHLIAAAMPFGAQDG